MSELAWIGAAIRAPRPPAVSALVRAEIGPTRRRSRTALAFPRGDTAEALGPAIDLANTPAEAAYIRLHMDRLLEDNPPGTA